MIKDDDFQKLDPEVKDAVKDLANTLREAKELPKQQYQEDHSSTSSGEREKHIAISERGYLEKPDKSQEEQQRLEGTKKERPADHPSKAEPVTAAKEVDSQGEMKGLIDTLRAQRITHVKESRLPERPSIDKQLSQQKSSPERER